MKTLANKMTARCRGLSDVAWQLMLADSTSRIHRLPPLMLEMAELIHGIAYRQGFVDGAMCGYEHGSEQAT